MLVKVNLHTKGDHRKLLIVCFYKEGYRRNLFGTAFGKDISVELSVV